MSPGPESHTDIFHKVFLDRQPSSDYDCRGTHRVLGSDLRCGPVVLLFLQMVEPVDLYWKCGLANPHTTHCLGNGQIMISCLGDPSGNGRGERPADAS